MYMVSYPLNNKGKESDETSRIFCGHVNFPEMNGGMSVNGGTKSNNHKNPLFMITQLCPLIVSHH